jgi:hypothetical protein
MLENKVTKAQESVDLSNESSKGGLGSLVSEDFGKNMQENWSKVTEELGSIGITDPDGLKQLLTMRNLTKDLSTDPASQAEATLTAIKVFEERVALDLKAARVENDQYLDTTMAVVSILQKNGLIDDQFVNELAGQVMGAMDYQTAKAETVIEQNMDFRGRINDTLEEIVRNSPDGIRATLPTMQKIQQFAAEATSGEEFVMQLAELAGEGGIHEQICLTMLEATPYFIAADEVTDGMDELRYFVNSF